MGRSIEDGHKRQQKWCDAVESNVVRSSFLSQEKFFRLKIQKIFLFRWILFVIFCVFVTISSLIRPPNALWMFYIVVIKIIIHIWMNLKNISFCKKFHVLIVPASLEAQKKLFHQIFRLGANIYGAFLELLNNPSCFP